MSRMKQDKGRAAASVGLGAPPIARRMRPASGCADAEVLMGKHWPQGGRGWLVGGGGRPRVAAETVKMQRSAEWELVKRGRGALVKWCSGAAERYRGGPWKAREGGRGEMTELAGRCWLVAGAGWCLLVLLAGASGVADSRR
ncbi:hypothetical protein F5882DRAFT_375623 [Hyaloscypha sp. PMI_1271]|nr:hypothetical protein F5882DRAFT_375623 [Hyaloscypha sp. PMI_1271]